jgi:hypothetical protein
VSGRPSGSVARRRPLGAIAAPLRMGQYIKNDSGELGQIVFAQPRTGQTGRIMNGSPVMTCHYSPIQTSRLHPNLHFVVGGHRIVHFTVRYDLDGRPIAYSGERLGRLKQLPGS